VGSDPCARSREPAVHARLRSARRGQFLAPPPRRLSEESGRRLRTWTHSSTEGTVESAHAVEFSKTVAPLLEGASFRRRARNPNRISERTHKYSAQNVVPGGLAPQFRGRGIPIGRE